MQTTLSLHQKALKLLPESLNTVMPLKRAHRSDLPDAVRELSTLLTTERAEMERPYWSTPRFVSAYLRYFLPWNLVRLHRLLKGLTLPEPALGHNGHGPLMVDLGSGPLSFPLALWLSSEKWRRTPVRLVCVDTAPRPLELGRLLFEDLAKRLNEPLLWSIRLERAPLVQGLRGVRESGDRPLLVTAGNVLNEWQGQHKGADMPLVERLGEVAEALTRALAPGGQAIMVEPGTRLGGTLTATLREAALECGLHPLAPCPHTHECPLLGNRDRGWCHVHYEAEPEAPEWLTALAKAALLTKHGLSLSYLQLGTEPPAPEHRFMARIISQSMAVPGMGLARYGCSADGLTLVARARFVEPNTLVEVFPSTDRDDKSGALKVTLEKDGRVTPHPSPSLPNDYAPQERPFGPRSSGDKPPFRGRSDRPDSDRPRSDRPRSDRPSSDRPRSDRPSSDRPRSDRPDSDRSRSDRPGSDRPAKGRADGEKKSWPKKNDGPRKDSARRPMKRGR